MKRVAQKTKVLGLQIRTFGQAEVLLAGQPIVWRSDTARQLFLYLLTHPLGQSRDHIIETLWHTQADANATNKFRVTVHRIRVALGWPEVVQEEHGRYRLAPEVLEASDIAAFSHLIEQAPHYPSAQTRLQTYQQALALYRGEYLLGEEGEWVWDVRDQLQAGYVRGTMEVAHLLWASGNFAASVKAQLRALQVDPYLGEQHHQRLMGCLWATQDKYAAIEYYRRFVHFLQQEIGDGPMPETIQLAQHVKQGVLSCQHCPDVWPLEGGSPSGPLTERTGLKLAHPLIHVA